MGKFLDFLDNLANGILFEMSVPPLKEACGEFLGTFFMMMCGNGVMAACVLSRTVHSILLTAFGWGFAVMIAISIAGGISGGHVNPAVTIALATCKRIPWSYVIPYILAQYLASFAATAVLYLIYSDAISIFDNGTRQLPPDKNSTAEIFSTYPKEFVSVWTCLIDQILGSALLLLVISAVADPKNLHIPRHSQPMIMGLGMTSVSLAFGYNCGAPLNPARDFAPRIFTAMCGYGWKVISYRNYTWFWIPILGPHIGAIFGVWIYKFLIELPVKTHKRMTEELEIIEYREEERRWRLEQMTRNEMPRPIDGGSSSSEDYMGRNLLERMSAPECEDTVPTNLSQRKTNGDAENET